MKVKIAIIGMGIMGCKYARIITSGQVKGAELAAVTRVRPEKMQEFSDVFEQQIPIFASADALFEAVEQKQLDVNAVLVVTPHLAHEEQVTRALQLGLHALCDKPAGAYSRQARMMREATAQHDDLVFGMVFNQRMNPVFQKMKEIVASGRYGKMIRMNWVMTDWYRPDSYYASGSWRGTWDGEGGGILLNQCPHNLDLLQWICGMPVSVQAFCKEGKYHDIAVEDEVTAYMEFASGATGTIYSTTGEASGINRLEISMEDALLVYENNELKVRELAIREAEYRKTATDFFAQPEGTWKMITCEGQDPAHVGVVQNFVNAIAGKEELFIPGAEGGKSLMLSNAMYLSSWQRRMVEMPGNLEEELVFEEVFETEFAKKAAGK